MSGRFVRASKYRHVFGRPTRKEQCYDNLRISKNAWDTNLIKVRSLLPPDRSLEAIGADVQKANPLYLSVNWEAGGGGSFAVIPVNERGRLPEQIPLFKGHTGPVLDTDWNPFNDSLIASGSDDGKFLTAVQVFIWTVPKNFTLYTPKDVEPRDVTPVSKLSGHTRKVGHVLFNPSAENILGTSSGDYTIKLWDIEAGTPRLTLRHADIVQSMSWSANGSLMVTTSRDKKLRVWDVRQERPAQEVAGHGGAKNSRAVWMGELDRVATTGFSKMSDRQLALWDIRTLQAPVGGFYSLDSISGVCMPFWDDGTQCLYLAGKGDGNIRYYEYENDSFEPLSEYKSADPQRGVAFTPKRGVNLHDNEVARAYKTVNDTYIEPISFIVPRRAEVFQHDIYPPSTGSQPGLPSADWFAGKDALPPKIDLEKVYDGEEPVAVAAESKPAPVFATRAASPPPKKEAEPQKSTPASTAAQRELPPSIKESKSSISEMASKFADNDDSEEDDGSSGFDRPSRSPDHTAPPKASHSAMKAPEKQRDRSPVKHTIAQPPQDEPSASKATSPDAPFEPDLEILGTLDEISSLLKWQNQALLEQQKNLVAQTEWLSQLTAEIDTLKAIWPHSRGSARKGV
ncbi:MAG: Coronin-like protein crn1 [Geoglossum umbratile]|nr:MAG: Coronin-like protein crn1 [Geoglossum umbratile]